MTTNPPGPSLTGAPREFATALALAPGMEGAALTTLRPSGKARFADHVVDVVTEGEFIAAETPVTRDSNGRDACGSETAWLKQPRRRIALHFSRPAAGSRCPTVRRRWIARSAASVFSVCMLEGRKTIKRVSSRAAQTA